VGIRLWAHGAPAFRLYLARGAGKRIFLQSSGSAPAGLEGLYLEGDSALERLEGLDRLLPEPAAERSLDLRAQLARGTLHLRLDGRSADIALPEGDWRPDLELRRVEGCDALMLDTVQLATLGPEGETLLASGRFGRLPVRLPLGLDLTERIGETGTRVVSLLGSLALTLLLELGLLGILAALGLRGDPWRLAALSALWPVEVALSVLLCTGLHLPYGAAALALASGLLLRLVLGLSSGREPARRPVAGRAVSALPAMGVALLCGALALAGVSSLPSVSQRWSWAILCGLPVLLQASAFALRCAARRGPGSKLGAVVAAGAVLALLLEGVLAVHPGLEDLLGSVHGPVPTEIDHRLLGDPFGELSSASSVVVGTTRWELPAPPGTFRVVCLGSSSTEGLGVEHRDRESWPGRLRALLAEGGHRDLEVINAGIIGASMTQLTVYLEQVLLPLEPDLVVLYFGGNMDSEEAQRFYRELREELDGDAAPNSPERLWAARQLRLDPPWAVSGFLMLCRSRLFMAAWGWATGAVEDGPVRATFGPRVTPTLIPGTARRLVALCVQEGIPLLLIPELLRTAALEPDNPDAEGIPGRTWHYTELFTQLAEEHADDGVRFGSIHDAFGPTDAQRSFLDEQHMNAEGYDRLARAILVLLEDEGLLPAPVEL
jgi:lysophospholipase L1-like esterase